MRSITVTAVTVTLTDDGLGNTTEETTEQEFDLVRFAPRSSSERTDPRVPAVISNASLYRRGEFPVASADRIVISGQHDLIDGTWHVEGEPGYWGRGVEVAIKRAG